MKTVCKSLQDIKQKLNLVFAPDITFRWDDKIKLYVVKAETGLGTIWLKKVSAIKQGREKLIPEYLFNDWYESALKCQLTVQQILDPEKDPVYQPSKE